MPAASLRPLGAPYEGCEVTVTPPPQTAESHVVGVDFGTLSGRAVVVRVRDGEEVGSAVHV